MGINLKSKIFCVTTGVAVAFFVVGALFWGGFTKALAYTNTTEFCISCHSMKDNPYEEYKHTLHYSNRSGVRAECADCHVPEQLGPKLVRKLEASREVWHHLLGSINTTEKFEAKRLELAANEWKRMKRTDSATCRHCHDDLAMSRDEQSRVAWRQHSRLRDTGETCIDCHQGLAHKLPEGWEDTYDRIADKYE